MITVRIYDNRQTRATMETTGEETTPTTSGRPGEHQVEYHSQMTVTDALNAVSYTAQNDVRVEVNGKRRDMSYVLRDGDRVTVTAKIHNG